MKNPTQDFRKVSEAQKAALDGLQTYAEKIEQERQMALLKHDLAWEAEKRRFEPKPEHHFHYGLAAPRLSQAEYRQLRAEHFQRRKEITDRFDEKAKDIQRVKENVLDRFNERAKGREGEAALSRKPVRTNRARDQGRSR